MAGGAFRSGSQLGCHGPPQPSGVELVHLPFVSIISVSPPIKSVAPPNRKFAKCFFIFLSGVFTNKSNTG